MGIVFNKRGGVGMGVTRPEPTPLPFLTPRHYFGKFPCQKSGAATCMDSHIEALF